MNQEFKLCLENKKIIPFESGKKLFKKELSIAQSDLSEAKAGYQNQLLQMGDYSGLLCYVPCCQGTCFFKRLSREKSLLPRYSFKSFVCGRR